MRALAAALRTRGPTRGAAGAALNKYGKSNHPRRAKATKTARPGETAIGGRGLGTSIQRLTTLPNFGDSTGAVKL